jgi:hypothetical protein
MATIFASCCRVSFSRHGILLLNFEAMTNFEESDNSPLSKINARKFREQALQKDAALKAQQKNSRSFNTRTFPSAKRQNTQLAPRYPGNSGFFHIVFH